MSNVTLYVCNDPPHLPFSRHQDKMFSSGFVPADHSGQILKSKMSCYSPFANTNASRAADLDLIPDFAVDLFPGRVIPVT